MIESFAPGKLFIAGEYAVIEPGHTAVLLAINRGIKLYLTKSLDRQGSISSYGEAQVYWNRLGSKINLIKSNKRNFAHVLSAIKTVESYIKDRGKALDYYHLKIESCLESEEGIKYGLGSSAAVTVATVKALIDYYGIKIPREAIFKLASISYLDLDGDSSCGDIAASVYGGWLAYTKFDRDWLLDNLKLKGINWLLENSWPKLKIEKLSPPKNMKILVAWTKSPAITTDLIHRIKNAWTLKNKEKFLRESQDCVNKMILAFKNNDLEEIKKQVRVNRQILNQMSRDLGVELETPLLSQLSGVAEELGAASKFSGAGGGDCGIAILANDKKTSPLIDRWGEIGLEYLALDVYN